MMQAGTNRLSIRTPEGVIFSLTLAGPFTRFLAIMVDQAMIAVISQLIGTLLAFVSVIGPGLTFAIMTIAYFVISIGYGIALEWVWRGQTVGKRLLRLRVMDVQGLKLTPSQIVIRNLMRFLDMIPGLYLVGGIACLVNRRCQRLGDLVANTIVVRQPKIRQPDLNQVLADKYNSFNNYPHLEARLRQWVSPAEAGLALQALLRRDEMEPDARIELFRDMADFFKEKVTFPQEVSGEISDEQYVRNVVATLYRSGTREAV